MDSRSTSYSRSIRGHLWACPILVHCGHGNKSANNCKIVASRFFYVNLFSYISTVIKHIPIMKITFDIKFLAIAIVSGIIAYMTVTESIDKYINFAGELNAMAFFLIASMMAAFSLVASVSISKAK